jgi:hypothetical protein
VLTRIGNALAWAIATGFANPMNAGGDLIIGGTNGAATRLGAGTAGQVLTMVAGAPAWVTPSGGGGGGAGDFKKDGSVQMTAALNEAPVFNLESASPAENIPDTAIAAANTIKVSGATSIRYLDFGGSSKVGTKRTLIFDSVLTLYHDLDYLILPGKASITTVVGDSAEFVCEGPNPRKWRCVRYTRADGTALVGSAGFTEDQVRATVLTGLEPARDDVRATDTVLAAMGKLQASKVTKIDGMGLSATDFSQEEKTKLNGIQPGAQVNAVTSVAGRTGAVTLTKSDVGLANADNTADSAKPVSVAQAAAINASKRAWAGSVINIGSSRALLASEVGNSFRIIPTSPITLTLPGAGAQPPGGVPYLLRNESLVVVTVSAATLIYNASGAQTNNLDLQPNEWIEIASNVGSWVVNQRGRLDVSASVEAVNAKLDVNNPTGLNNMTMRTYSASQSSSLAVERSRGTPAAPTPALNNDKIGSFSFQSLDSGGNLYPNVVLEAFARADQTPTNRGSLFQFATVKSGESTRTVALQIDDGGKISMPNGFYAGMPSRLAPYTLSTLPTASGWTNFLIIVTNATGGPKVCYSNGTNWLILNTTTPVS